MKKIISGTDKKDIFAIVKEECGKLENNFASIDNYEKLLKEQDFDFCSTVYVHIARNIVKALNENLGAKISLRDLDMNNYLDFDKLSRSVITYDEFKDMLSVARKYISNNDLSYRELVMIEMAWIGSSPQQMVEVLDDDVQIIKLPDLSAIYYTRNDREFYYKDEEFVKDFSRYRAEVKAGQYRKMRTIYDKNVVAATMYADSDYFIKKTKVGKCSSKDTRFVRNETAVASFLEQIQEIWDNDRVNIKDFAIQNFIDSAYIYNISKGATREEIESRYESYVVSEMKEVQIKFFEILSERLYGAPQKV